MTRFENVHLLLGRACSLVVSSALVAAAFAWAPSVPAQNAVPAAASQTASSSTQPCSWPLEVDGRGTANYLNPDTDATYWVMPVDTSTWQSMIVKGQYTHSRFFSFTSYYNPQQRSPRVASSTIDADIAPDPGSVNPFAAQTTDAPAPGNYTITFDSNASGTGNHLQWAVGQVTYILYRVYVADGGLGYEAGVPLPSLTLIDSAGQQYPLSECKPGNSETAALQSTLATLAAGAPPPQTCPTSAPAQVTFAPGGENGVFPNPAATYYIARGLCPQASQVVVVRGQAADFPDTYHGSSIFQPDFPDAGAGVQLRYWSLCNDKEEGLDPTAGCRADYNTQRDWSGFYTYVIAPEESGGKPAWVPTGVTWLPWGDPTVQSMLFFRVMLPAPGFELTGPYLPQGVYCDKDVFAQEGSAGCFGAAGAAAPSVLE